MTDAPRPVLTDPAQPPTGAVLATHLGSAAPLWDSLFGRIRAEHPNLREEWRYYRDGGAWLLKITHGSRTICWVSVHDGGFRLTGYLPARAEPTVAESTLRPDLKRQFSESTSARTRAMTVWFTDETDVDAGLALVALRDAYR